MNQFGGLKHMLKQVNKKRRKVWLAGAAAAIVLLAVFAVIMFSHTTLTAQQWDDLYKQGTYLSGIRIEGFDVGGMTMSQAGQVVRQRMQQRMLDVRVTIDNNGQQFVLDSDDFEIADNVDNVLKAALAVAREGSRVEINRQLGEIEKNGLDFSTDYTVNPSPVKQRILEIALAVDVPATDAAVQVNKDDRENRFSYTDEASGCKVDQDALYAAVEQQVRTREYGTVKMPVLQVEPMVTKAELMANTVPRATASTSFGHSPYNRESRVFNIKKAVGLINGYKLLPGEEFSTNTVLGPRTYELGWQPAPAVVRGGSEDQAGGGVCQVSSTMYNAVLKAGLEIVNRQGHSIKLSYVDGGLDATINTGTIDFIYRNNTDHDIYIFCWVNSGKQTVNFEFFGEPFSDEYDEIRLSSEKLETLKPEGDMIVMVDKTKPAGYEEIVVKRREGFVYATYKHYYKNGVEVKEPELIGKTKYRPYAGEKIVGPPMPVVAEQPVESAEPVNEALSSEPSA
jgi:vancomycin resistance protein YoaR